MDMQISEVLDLEMLKDKFLDLKKNRFYLIILIDKTSGHIIKPVKKVSDIIEYGYKYFKVIEYKNKAKIRNKWAIIEAM